MQPVAVRRISIAFDNEPARHSAAIAPVVLLVTDDAALRAAMVRALEAERYVVRAVAHGGHAVLACLNRDRVDVLVTEWWMPDTSGPALAARLRRHHPGLPALYLARPGTPDRDDLLVRPFTRDALVRRLESAFRVSASPAR